MVSFKISYGKESNLPRIIKNGNMYFCTDTGNLFIDHLSERIHVNAKKAQMLTYLDTETNEYIDIDAKTLLELSNGGSADWNQNDPEAKDYVKNRTHYVDSVIINNEYPNGILEELVSERTGEHIYKISNDVFDIQNGFYGTIVAEIKDVDCTFNINGEDFLEGPSKSTFRTIEHNESCLGLQIRYEQGAAIRIGEFLIVISDSYEYATRLDTWILSRGIWVNNGIIKSVSAIKSIMQLDERFIPDTIARKSDILGSEQSSDWNQNDETAPDYIKNRTHWEENNQTVIEWDGSTEDRDRVIDKSGAFEAEGIAFYKVSDLVLAKEDVIGGTVRVIMESVPSELPLTEDTVDEEDGVINISEVLLIFTNTTAVFSGITLEVPSVGCYAASLGQGIVRFESLTYGSNMTHKLDPKFLPDDGFGWEGTGPNIIAWDCNVTEEMKANSFQIYGPNTITIAKLSDLTPTKSDLIGGSMHVGPQSISITDEFYEGMFEERNNHTSISEVMYIFYDTNYSRPGSEQFTVPSTGVYVNIKGTTPITIEYGSTPVIHQIDEKFIPDTIARKSDISTGGSSTVISDWNQNDPAKPDYIKNRTHWEENNQTIIEWDGNTEGLEQWDFTMLGSMLYKVSDATPTLDELYGGLLGAHLGENYMEMELVGQDYNDIIDLNNEINPVNCKFVGRFFIVYDTDVNFYGQAFTLTSTGIWATPDFRKLVYGTNSVHPLDEKFIPDTIARKSDIVPGVSSWNDLLDKPSALPNPQSLTFRGAVNASYDGSKEVVVEIPVVKAPVTSVNGMTGDVTINIPNIPVTSVNGMTGDVQIDIPEPTGSNFIVTLTVTEWTEQINSKGLFASLPNCSHTFQEIHEAYNADKTIIFDLIDSRDQDTHIYLPLTQKTKMNGETTYWFGVDFGGTFVNGYFSRYATRPTVFKKVYMEKITVDSASVGQTVVVKSVDYKGVPTTWEAVDLPSGSSSQSDWNQNDSTQPNYVKNRTHWEEGSDYVIAELNDAVFDENGNADRIDIGDYGHLTVGNKYTIIWDGVEYSQLVAFDDGDYPTIGSPFNNIGADFPFCIFTEKLAGKISLCVSCADKFPSVHSFTVSEGGKVYHPINEKFIPDIIARVSDIPTRMSQLEQDIEISSSVQADWNQNDDTQPDYIKNRTHYDGLEDHIIEWDGSTDFREYCDIPGDRYYKISDYCPSEEEILAGAIEYSNGEVQNVSQELFSGFANAQAKYDDYLYFINGVIVSSGNTLTQGLDGTYARIVNDVYPVKFIYRSATVHPLDERFIPDTIARVSDISNAIVSAGTVKVGQTIRVKHINISGKIEWEAVDFPEADLSAYYTKAEIDSLLNGYIAEVDAIIG